jgi:hypothetical protein
MLDEKKLTMVDVGQMDEGLAYFPQVDDPNCFWVHVTNHASFLKTSPVTKILEYDLNSTTFRTQNSVYKLTCLEEDGDPAA